jgi:hypothetical protein
MAVFSIISIPDANSSIEPREDLAEYVKADTISAVPETM